jgi:hypothetical protein
MASPTRLVNMAIKSYGEYSFLKKEEEIHYGEPLNTMLRDVNARQKAVSHNCGPVRASKTAHGTESPVS